MPLNSNVGGLTHMFTNTYSLQAPTRLYPAAQTLPAARAVQRVRRGGLVGHHPSSMVVPTARRAKATMTRQDKRLVPLRSAQRVHMHPPRPPMSPHPRHVMPVRRDVTAERRGYRAHKIARRARSGAIPAPWGRSRSPRAYCVPSERKGKQTGRLVWSTVA